MFARLRYCERFCAITCKMLIYALPRLYVHVDGGIAPPILKFGPRWRRDQAEMILFHEMYTLVINKGRLEIDSTPTQRRPLPAPRYSAILTQHPLKFVNINFLLYLLSSMAETSPQSAVAKNSGAISDLYDQNVALKASCIHSRSKYTPFLLCIRKSRVQISERVGIILSENFYYSQGKRWEQLQAMRHTAGYCPIFCQFYFSFIYLERTKWSVFISVINQIDAQNFCFTVNLFQASTCFEHCATSSGGQNCISQPLVSSHCLSTCARDGHL